MDDLKISQLCSFLTKSDIACGFIRNESIVKPRDEIIRERLVFYKPMITDIWAEIISNNTECSSEEVFNYLLMSVKLVQADIESLFISIEPVLYDRDSMIKERILSHYNELVNLV